MERDKFEYLTAYKLAVKLNNCDIDFLIKLHKRKKSTIEGYVYENKRNPKFELIFELYIYLRLSNKIIPIELKRLWNRHYYRAYRKANSQNF